MISFRDGEVSLGVVHTAIDHSTVIGEESTSLTCTIDHAVGSGVKSGLVLGIGIDTFDDVDFTTSRPVFCLRQCPECRPVLLLAYLLATHILYDIPCSTDATRHVKEVTNDQAFIVIFLCRDPDALTSRRSGSIESAGVVNTNVGSSANRTDETIALGHRLIDIVDETIGRIRPSEEVPSIEEIKS